MGPCEHLGRQDESVATQLRHRTAHQGVELAVTGVAVAGVGCQRQCRRQAKRTLKFKALEPVAAPAGQDRVPADLAGDGLVVEVDPKGAQIDIEPSVQAVGLEPDHEAALRFRAQQWTGTRLRGEIQLRGLERIAHAGVDEHIIEVAVGVVPDLELAAKGAAEPCGALALAAQVVVGIGC